MLQCGDPANNGSGGPGYEIKDENLDKVDYSVVGTVAMANAGPGPTAASSSSSTRTAAPACGKDYTEIGHVTTGMDVIQKVVAGRRDRHLVELARRRHARRCKLTFTKVTVAPPVVGSGTVVTPSPTAPPATGGAGSGRQQPHRSADRQRRADRHAGAKSLRRY